MRFALPTVFVLVGLAIFYWAPRLSLRYNAWTARLRESHPNINPPPTPERRQRTTTTVTFLLRLFGGYLVFLSARMIFNF